MKALLKHLIELGPVILIAAFGGYTRTLTGKKQGEKYDWKIGLGEVMIAVFAGLLIHWSLTEYDIGANARATAVALAGYSARGVLSIFDRQFIDRLKRLSLWLLPVAALVCLAGCASLAEKDVTTYSEVEGGKVTSGATADTPIPSAAGGWWKSFFCSKKAQGKTRVFYYAENSHWFSNNNSGKTMILVEGDNTDATIKVKNEPKNSLDLGIMKIGVGDNTTKVEIEPGKAEGVTKISVTKENTTSKDQGTILNNDIGKVVK